MHNVAPPLYPGSDGLGRRERIMFGLVSLTGALPGLAQHGPAFPARLMPCCLHAVNASPAMFMNCATCFFTPGFDSGGFALGVRLPPPVFVEDCCLKPELPSTHRFSWCLRCFHLAKRRAAVECRCAVDSHRAILPALAQISTFSATAFGFSGNLKN